MSKSIHRLCSVCHTLFAVLFVLLPVRGANAPAPAPARYRYLFAIDTSETMAAHKDEIARFLGQTIRGGFDGWIRRNETIGFWTFNQKLTRDAFPVQFWTPTQKERHAEQAERWLAQARFGKSSRQDLALAELERVATGLEAVTILLISDGSQPMLGTPFDAAINQIYANLLRSGPALAPAVITRLTVREGVFSSWAVLLLENSSAATKLADLAPLETELSPAFSATNLAASGSIATNLAAIRAQANGEKPKEIVTEKPLPPPPILAKELFAPIRVAPLQFEEDDQPGKSVKPRKPLFTIPAEPGHATPNNPKPPEAAVASPGDLKEKEKNAAISAPGLAPVNVKPLATAQKTELLSEAPAPKVAAAAKTTVETAGTNAIESSIEGRTTSKLIAESVRETPQGDSSTNSVISITPQVRTNAAQSVASGPALLKKTPEMVNASEKSPAKIAGQGPFALGRSEIRSAAPGTNSSEVLLKPSLAMARPASSTPAFLFAGLAFLVLAGLLVWLSCRISRAPRQPSLISRSFNRDNKQNEMNAPKLLDTRC